jgi:predicted nucleic acid-binding protein
VIVLDAPDLGDYPVDRPEAGSVLGRIEDEDLRTAAHQPAEVASGLTRRVRTGEVAAEAARDALREAMRLPQKLVVPTAAQPRRAFELGERIRVADALYVALAEEHDATLVTTDCKLARAEPPCQIAITP